MLLIAAFIFFAVAIMFIIRYVILILVIILSPLAFVSFVLPGLDGKFKEWWNALSGQAFFAPIYFMLTYVTLTILGGIRKSNLFQQAGGSLSDVSALGLNAGGAVEGSVGFIPTFINFAVVIVFLIASLIIAKSWANKAGSGAAGLTKWAMGAAGGATLGMAGRFGRGTVGRAGQAIAENEWLKDKASTSRLARLGLATSKKTAGASFDIRGVGALSALEAGKAQKGGFAKDLKDKVDAQKKYADVFKPSDLRVVQAERELANAKKTGTPSAIAEAQASLDRIVGASEDALRQRKLKELRARGMSKQQAKIELDRLEDTRLQEINRLTASGMTQEKAEEDAANRNIGWAAKAEKGWANTRKEAYAKKQEEQTIIIPKTNIRVPFSITGRLGVIGPVKRERREEANAIRKSMKEKKPGEKIAEEIEKQSRESTDSTGTPEPTPATPATGGTPPTP